MEVAAVRLLLHFKFLISNCYGTIVELTKVRRHHQVDGK